MYLITQKMFEGVGWVRYDFCMSEGKENGIPPHKVLLAGLAAGGALAAVPKAGEAIDALVSPPGIVGTVSATPETVEGMIDLGSIKLEERKDSGTGTPASE